MCEALDDHESSVSIGGRFIPNFRFADDIVVNAEEEEEAGVLIDRLDRTTTRCKVLVLFMYGKCRTFRMSLVLFPHLSKDARSIYSELVLRNKHKSKVNIV